jgi:hypothetical protein
MDDPLNLHIARLAADDRPMISIWDPKNFTGRWGWWHRFVIRVFFAGSVSLPQKDERKPGRGSAPCRLSEPL